MMKMKLNFEELPQATAFLLEKVEELTISINEMKQLLKRQTAAKEEMRVSGFSWLVSFLLSV